MSKSLANSTLLKPELVTANKPSDPKKKANTGAGTNTKVTVKVQEEKSKEMKTERMLEGTLNVVPHIDYTHGKVYELEGLSKQFDGSYYVKQCNHSIRGGEYTVTMGVIKNELGSNAFPYAKVDPPRKVEADNKVVGQIKHTIAKGETLSSISKKYKVTMKSLMEINKIKKQKDIKVGQVIKITK